MLPETTQQLILKLWDLTDRGVIPWKPGETDGEHLFETEGYVVAVSGQPPSVRILRPRGHEVERADAAELSATKWPRPNASRFDEAVRELATRAAEHANGARKTVAATMSAISTPARAPTAAASSATGKPIFGAIESFDISGPSANEATNEAGKDKHQTPDQAEHPTAQAAYSPWLTT